MDEQTVFHTRARIVAREAGKPDTDPEGGRFEFPAEISSNALDTYFTHMSASTLRNFAADAQAGVSFLDSHDGRKLGIGYSYGAKYEEEGDVSRTVAQFYTVPGIRFGGQHSFASTDDVIKAIEKGLVRDVSVGFFGGKWTCDVCKSEYWSYDCPHIAGLEYEISDGEDDATEKVACTVTIRDARLSEVSAVYDGATPGAAIILKAQKESDRGRLSSNRVRELQRRFRINLPVTEKAAAGDPEEQRMLPKNETETDNGQSQDNTDLAVILTDIRGVVSGVAPTDLSDLEQVRWIVARVSEGNTEIARLTTELETTRAKVTELGKQAEDGRAYRKALIDQVVVEGVRALGAEAFPEETYRLMLGSAPIEQVAAIKESFARQALEKFPAGRHISDDVDESEDRDAAGDQGEQAVVPVVPDGAYGA